MTFKFVIHSRTLDLLCVTFIRMHGIEVGGSHLVHDMEVDIDA